ncbi:MAG: flagellar hook-associated protein FlgK, partial [Synergistaceae bacterium]|nr:flagellar hook-associated protein FlgK [Synergistaceae bacterium]
MSSTFGGLEMGRNAVNAFRLGMQTVGHNISNMNTEGYSRQRAVFRTVTPEDIPNIGQLGQGMNITDIERIRDEFLDFQFRDKQAALGYWTKINDLYDSIQSYISEPASSGIRSAMDTFFTNMQTLQQTPEDTSARQALVTSANSLALMLGNLVDSFDTYNESINMELKQSVAEANTMLHDIAHLNLEISEAEALGQNANDLYDKRDLLIDKLSKMMDISYNEPKEHDGIKGEFFLSVNGKVLVQGTKVRELAAHAFMWDNQVYYDVQVCDNEFDIVSNKDVADALAVGPEGTYQLIVDRVANGLEWTIGGGNAHCLDTFAVRTSAFSPSTTSTGSGVLLNADSEDLPYKIQFRTLNEDSTPSVLTVSIAKTASNTWELTGDIDGDAAKAFSSTISSTDLTTKNLSDFIDTAIKQGFNISVDESRLTENPDTYALLFSTDYDSPLEVTDYSGMLGVLTEAKRELTSVTMRAEPTNLEDALNISGSFRIQVGTQGTRVTSENFKASPSKGLGEGEILPKGEAGEKYTFRVGVSGDQVDFTASWNNSLGKWVLSSDMSTETRIIDSVNQYDEHVVTVKDLTDFMSDTFLNAVNADNPALVNMSVTTGKSSSGVMTQFYLESGDNHLISISDVEGDLAARLGIVNENPVITIDVESSDSLITIRNKINEKYQEEFGLTEPEQWVHASVDNGYLEISANVAGEAQRITLMGSEDGNMQVLRRLGLTANQKIATDMVDDDGNIIYSYREIAYIPDSGLANDASFTLNNVRYLSSDNKFNKARRIPAASGDSRERYSAASLSEVSEGMWLNLKNAGSTTITVRHHIRDGSMKALEEIRDGIIPDLKDTLDNMAYGLAKHMNAYQYSGYGVGGDITTTGVAFFNQLGTKADAAKRLSVTDKISTDPSLIGAAMGKKNADGFAVSGISGGSGDGTNASRMVGLNFSKILENHTLTVGGVYDGMLSQIGAEAASAKLMYTTQATVSEQIDSQRQACSGVNLDEELMDMIILNRAFGAMGRYINTYDEMLDRIINGFGLVGR